MVVHRASTVRSASPSLHFRVITTFADSPLYLGFIPALRRTHASRCKTVWPRSHEANRSSWKPLLSNHVGAGIQKENLYGSLIPDHDYEPMSHRFGI